MSKVLTSSNKFLMSGGRWLTREYVPPEPPPPPPPTRYVYLNQSTGGTISASPMSGVDGDTVTLSNTPSTNYTFNGYSVNGSTLYSGNKFDFNGSDVTCSASWTYHDPGRGPMPTEGLLYLTDFYGANTKYIYAVRKDYYYDNYRYSAIPYHSNTDSYGEHRAINYGDNNPKWAKHTFSSSEFPGLQGMPSSYEGKHWSSVAVNTSGPAPAANFPYYNEPDRLLEYSTAFWAASGTNTPVDCTVISYGLRIVKWNQNDQWKFKIWVKNGCTLTSGSYCTFTPYGEYSSDSEVYMGVTNIDLSKMHHYNVYVNRTDTSTNGGLFEIYLDGVLLVRIRGNRDILTIYPVGGFGAGLRVSEFCLYDRRVIHYPDRPIEI